MKPIIIIAAVPRELDLLEEALGSCRQLLTSGQAVVEGTIGNLPVVSCVGGVGKVNAAAATALMIERYQPRLVISTGCAGAYVGSGLAVGDLVLATDEVLADEGVLVGDGWKDLRYMNLPSVRRDGETFYNVLPLSRRASERAMELAEREKNALHRGVSVTVSTCSGTGEYGAELSRRWNAVMENMEGAAVAQVCLRAGVECLEIRGISNLVEERDLTKWDFGRAVEVAQRFVLLYLQQRDSSPVVCRC